LQQNEAAMDRKRVERHGERALQASVIVFAEAKSRARRTSMRKSGFSNAAWSTRCLSSECVFDGVRTLASRAMERTNDRLGADLICSRHATPQSRRAGLSGAVARPICAKAIARVFGQHRPCQCPALRIFRHHVDFPRFDRQPRRRILERSARAASSK
jgi:hypothetical protein